MSERNDLIEYLLHLGDSAMIQGQRLCEWCGHAPALEEEMALTNLSLDFVGQARNWLDYAAELLNDGRDADHLAFRRDERAYRNLLLVEQPNGDFAVTTLKQFFYDAWHFHVLEGLAQSTDARIAAIAAKALKEVRYHLKRSSEWIIRLGDGTEESNRRLREAIPGLWRFTLELVEGNGVSQRLHQSGIAPSPEKIAEAWRNSVAAVFAEAGLTLPEPPHRFYLDGRKGLHTEHLGTLLAEMQFLQRAYPDATW